MTLAIVVITCAVSLMAFSDRRVFEALLFQPYIIEARRDWHRFITHAFVHGDLAHLAVNMYVFYLFGSKVEGLLGLLVDGPGWPPFLALYGGGVLFSSLPGYRKHRHDPGYRAVGASGAVSAVLFAYILMLPMSRIGLIFIPGNGVPAIIFGLLYLGYEWYMDKRGGDNVAHDAHFFGALFGLVFVALLEPGLLLHLGHLQDLLNE